MDLSSWGEQALELVIWSAGILIGLSAFAMLALLHDGPAFGWTTLLFMASSVVFFLALWARNLVDDTYLLHLPTRSLMYQKCGPLGLSLKKVRSFEELVAVGVDFDGFRQSYSLVFVDQSGKKIRVSDLKRDWTRDGFAFHVHVNGWGFGVPLQMPRVDRNYEQFREQARELSLIGGWALCDQGPEQELVAQCGRDGRVRVGHQNWGILYRFLQALGFLVWLYFLWVSHYPK